MANRVLQLQIQQFQWPSKPDEAREALLLQAHF